MKKKTEIELNKEDIINLINEKYQIGGDVEFVIKEETYKAGYSDEGWIYKIKHIFDKVKITNKNENTKT